MVCSLVMAGAAGVGLGIAGGMAGELIGDVIYEPMQ